MKVKVGKLFSGIDGIISPLLPSISRLAGMRKNFISRQPNEKKH
jgi:hypothetical protein